MQEVPLFPLQTVLFPNAPLRLHIFEERYKHMVNACIDEKQPFGVVLIRHGIEALGPLAEPYSVGTLARILQVQRLTDGRMNIAVIGSERFRIMSLEPDLQPYLIGYVEPLALLRTDPGYLAAQALVLRRWLNRYLQIMAEGGAGQFDSSQLPQDPGELAFLCASLLPVSDLEKQAILSIESAEDLVDDVSKVCRREIALLKVILKENIAGQSVFSKN